MADDIQGFSRLIKRLGQLAIDTRQTEKPLRAAGAIAIGSIQKNFDEQGRPEKWTPLSPRTLGRRRKGRGKGGPKILIDTARLKNSIGFKLVEGPGVMIGTNVIYARRQHFGYPGGKGRGRARTPARPFLMLHGEDIRKIDEIFTRHVKK